MTEPRDELRPEVLLSLQRALLGAVPETLRGVTCDWNRNEIKICCYFDGEITEEDEELMEMVTTEVLADFPEHTVDLDCLRYDAPQPLSDKVLRAWVYMRKE